MAITITTEEAPKLLMKALTAGLVPMLHSSPGLGKSSIVRTLAEENGLKVIDLRLSQMDPTDLNGLPSFNKDKTKSAFIPPDYFPLEGDEIPEGYTGWCLFFDEVNAAPASIQSAAYKIILDRMVGQFNLHRNVAIIAAGNLTNDRAITHRMSTALQSRMIHLQLEQSASTWIKWAVNNNIDHRIIAYIGFKPDGLHVFNPDHSDFTFSCSRTWEFASKIIKPELSIDIDILPLIIGTIGEGSGREFFAFCQIYTELPTIEQILANPTGIPIPDEPSQKYAITGLLAHHMTTHNIDKLMVFANRLRIEFTIITLRQALAKNQSLLTTAPLKEWIKNNATQLFE